jgi:N5-(carboxyethyl)ornithine synthase
MKRVGFLISNKENENRRALLPHDIKGIKHKNSIYVEKNYGKVLGFSDIDYLNEGVHICSRDEIFDLEIICDPKIGDSDYLNGLSQQVIFGWVHAVQNEDITNILIKNKLTVFAWEDMFYENRHVFWRNNEIAGEAAIMHAFLCYGKFPYNTKVALLGRGNIARGALKILTFMGADVVVYNRKTENLFIKELSQFDVIVNAILWDTSRKDHIIYRHDLKRIKKGSLIIDISCDRNGAVESSIPTSIDNPTYVVDGIIHYVVDHTPALFYKTTSESLSKIVSTYIDKLIDGNYDETLLNSMIIEDGNLLDEKIKHLQKR